MADLKGPTLGGGAGPVQEMLSGMLHPCVRPLILLWNVRFVSDYRRLDGGGIKAIAFQACYAG
jgi:hypothetical protein